MNSIDEIKAEECLSKKRAWKEWIGKIPFFALPAGYEFQPIPPFGGAVARFCARKKGCKKIISIYFDPYMNLGHEAEPYWEIYPASNGDTKRFYSNESKRIVREIVKSLSNKKRKKK